MSETCRWCGKTHGDITTTQSILAGLIAVPLLLVAVAGYVISIPFVVAGWLCRRAA